MIEVRWIKTKDGKELPIRFGEAVLVNLADAEGVPFSGINKMMASIGTWPPGRFYRLIMYALKDGARRAKVEFTLTSMEDVVDMLEEDKDLLEKIMNVFNESQPKKKTPPVQTPSRRPIRRS